MARLYHSEHREESRGGKEKKFFAYALNDKLMVNGQWLIVMPGTRYPNAEEHPPLPPFKGGKERSEGGMLSLQRGEERSAALGNGRTQRRSSMGLGR